MSDGHGARREPDEQESKHTHAGNGTVNHGPDDQGPDVQGSDGLRHRLRSASPAGGGPIGDGPGGGLAPDEEALRRLLHEAVQEVEPRDGTLEYLRRAVPARRARKRQAAVGLAAAALFVGTAIPALVHVSHSTGPGANPSVAGHASQAQGGVGQGKDPAGGEGATVGSDQEGKHKEKPESEEKGKDEKEASGPGAGGGGTDPSSSSAPDAVPCTADQLGTPIASSAAPDSTGVVYGSFRVGNVSSASCTVAGPGSVGVSAQGAADPARVSTARHVAGDPAAGLPDPSLEAGNLLLKPGGAYEVRFAWVPSETCPTTGGTTGGATGGPSPDPSPTGETSATGGTTTGGDGTDNTTTQLLTADTPAGGSVTVTYSPETGSGSATATVSNACAGTVYWTGVLAGA
ncbi:hypothetical protein [Streptomyces fumanus]|uniref:DUF4232 domain-containing protein n=1 Tax=Streptomyces fumanus TaxID=67302 RepID=A0A919DWY2_9ACTN|nr:hypothetical protein [Streptomyces fumanus]GHE88645.1 hypothetical protein GCM10018772_10420 [Streptomyces fumanus]